MKIKLNNQGQMLASGMSIAYSIVFTAAVLIAMGLLIIYISDTFLGIQLYYYMVKFGVNPNMLGYLESIRTLIPFAILLNATISLVIIGQWLSNWG